MLKDWVQNDGGYETTGNLSTAPPMTSHQSSVLRIDLSQESDCIYSESYGFLHFHCILSVDQKLITLK